jgi:hypothetical protein
MTDTVSEDVKRTLAERLRIAARDSRTFRLAMSGLGYEVRPNIKSTADLLDEAADFLAATKPPLADVTPVEWRYLYYGKGNWKHVYNADAAAALYAESAALPKRKQHVIEPLYTHPDASPPMPGRGEGFVLVTPPSISQVPSQPSALSTISTTRMSV